MNPRSKVPNATAAAPAEVETTTGFAHTSLDAYRLALQALVHGDRIARGLPRGYGPLRDQLSRALESAYLQTCVGAAKRGGERRVRLGSARAEAGEAAGAVVAVAELGLCNRSEAEAVSALLGRLCATLTGLSNRG